MKFVRTLPTTRLIGLVATVVVVFSALAGLAVAAYGSSESPPPAKPLDTAIHDALATTHPDGIAARIRFTNNLLPSGALLDNVASALITGASGRLWVTGDGRARFELQSDAGDVQVVWDRPTITVYDASSNTVYKATLPADAGGKNDGSRHRCRPDPRGNRRAPCQPGHTCDDLRGRVDDRGGAARL
jgi:hypothetical protein